MVFSNEQKEVITVLRRKRFWISPSTVWGENQGLSITELPGVWFDFFFPLQPFHLLRHLLKRKKAKQTFFAKRVLILRYKGPYWTKPVFYVQRHVSCLEYYLGIRRDVCCLKWDIDLGWYEKALNKFFCYWIVFWFCM